VILVHKEIIMEQLLGKRVQTFRERLEMSPDALAKASGLDVALIHGIENGDVYPALGVLVKLSRALGQRLGTFMDDQFQEDPLVVRSDARLQQIEHHKSEDAAPYCYFPLGKGKTDRHMDPFFIEIHPHHEEETSSHEGEELIIVVSGAVDLRYGKKRFTLQPGDSIYYNSIVPHCVSAAGGSKAEIYAVIFMPF